MPDFAVPPDFLDALRPGPRRLMLTDDRLADLKSRDDADLARLVDQSLAQAEEAAAKDPLVYQIPDGLRLLGVSRDCVARIYALGLAWRWTGESKYLERGIDALLAVCAFDDWNPRHFLDTAEMAHAVGVGYDWFFDELSDAQRSAIRDGLIRNGLEAGIECYDTYGIGTEDRGKEPREVRRYGWWVRCDHNWNQVCNGGLVAGALAIADTHPRYAERIITEAVASLPRALKMYGPDGAWAEGPGYWGYATRYTAYGFTALQTALGTDFGLLGIEGVSEAGLAPVYTTGPTGLYLNYADSGERNARRPMFAEFWLSDVFRNDFIAHDEHALLDQQEGTPAHVVWYVPRPAQVTASRDLDRQFRGPVEVALFRSAWDDPDALFVGFKAGYNQANHAHLDLGNFELDALGVRWARDLGSDNYNLPNYWDGKRGGHRWEYFRLGSRSHNVPLVDGANQDPLAGSRMTSFVSGGDFPHAIVDLTEAYEATSVRRGIGLVDSRRDVLVQDEFEADPGVPLTWAITTDAEIDLRGDTAVLTLDGRQLAARILSPSGATFAAESAERNEPEKANDGVSRLLVTCEAGTARTTIAVLLSPEWEPGREPRVPDIRPLSSWTNV